VPQEIEHDWAALESGEMPFPAFGIGKHEIWGRLARLHLWRA
jgi:hypothetical protein